MFWRRIRWIYRVVRIVSAALRDVAFSRCANRAALHALVAKNRYNSIYLHPEYPAYGSRRPQYFDAAYATLVADAHAMSVRAPRRIGSRPQRELEAFRKNISRGVASPPQGAPMFLNAPVSDCLLVRVQIVFAISSPSRRGVQSAATSISIKCARRGPAGIPRTRTLP